MTRETRVLAYDEKRAAFWHCRAFRLQIETVARAARAAAAALDAEPPQDFESTIVQRLRQ